MTKTHVINGRCHCGNIQYVLRTDTPLVDVRVRVCRCEFCLRHRPRYWSDPNGALKLSVGNPAQLRLYRFGHGTADFVICRNCGVFCCAIAVIGGAHYAVTNLNLALDRDAEIPESFIEALSETEAERTARRRRNWTPVASGWPAVSG